MTNRGHGAGPGRPDGATGTLEDLVSSYAAHRAIAQGGEPVRIIDTEVLAPGRPGIVDLVAEAGSRTLHLPVGLRVPGDQVRLLPEGEEPVLGTFEDADGVAVASEVLGDAELSVLLLRAVTGLSLETALVRRLRSDKGSVTLAMDDRFAFTVFTEVTSGQRSGLELLIALDEVGFNHIAAPVALWQRGGRDLGILQEYLPGASVGSALAMTSVRDLYASGGPPELAGGDFGAEAQRLGVMTARMHLGLDRAFGRRNASPSQWADDIGVVVGPVAPSLLDHPEVVNVLALMRNVQEPCHAIRTHGDFHLGRVYRTEQGWYVGDLEPGGRPSTRAGVVDGPLGEAEEGPVFRSPLADLADMFWSFGYMATSAADERDPTGREGLVELAVAWEQRNRDAFLTGYLGVPGVTDLVPHDVDVVLTIVSAFELERRAETTAVVRVDDT